MTDTLAFKALLVKRGYTLEKLSDELGITISTLSYKVNNRRQFKPSEIIAIKNILGMTSAERDSIFFGDDVDK